MLICSVFARGGTGGSYSGRVGVCIARTRITPTTVAAASFTVTVTGGFVGSVEDFWGSSIMSPLVWLSTSPTRW